MSQCYVGEIRPFAGTFAPVGWALCDGSLLSISNYQALFSLIGTTYGGNGQTTFALPDLRGRAVINQGQGSGLSSYVIGQPVGLEAVTLTTGQMPAHQHTFSVTNAAAGAPGPSASAVPGSAPADNPIYVASGNQATLSAQAVAPTGSSLPHANRQPYLAITYIIALEGIYPSQN